MHARLLFDYYCYIEHMHTTLSYTAYTNTLRGRTLEDR